jgi:glutaconate CoA-transferase subunit A
MSKLITLSEAISRFVPDGSSVALGLALEGLIPFAAGHEIIRQGVRDLTLIGPISDILFEQIIGAGCVRKVIAAWVGNVITGSGYNFRRAVEEGQIEVQDHSNLSVTMALLAGSLGIPFMPLRSALGTDLFQTNPAFKEMTCPYTEQKLATVAALNPDVTIVHIQRADEEGNAHLWGSTGISKVAAQAARHVIVVAEEIVGREVIASDPNRTLFPGFRVSAVVHEPWGAHPSPVPGYYRRDHQRFVDYSAQTKTADGFRRWLERWVLGVADRGEYCRRLLGEEGMDWLRLTVHAPSTPVDYGY